MKSLREHFPGLDYRNDFLYHITVVLLLRI